MHIAQAIAISEVRGELILRIRVGGLSGRSSSRPTVRKVGVKRPKGIPYSYLSPKLGPIKRCIASKIQIENENQRR